MGVKDTIVSSIAGAAGAVMTGLDGLFTSDDERNKSKIEIEKVFAGLTTTVLSSVGQMEAERTTRHANDMKSDSWLSKNIRPATLIFLLVAVTFFAYLDSSKFDTDSMFAGFSIEDRWVSLYSGLLEVAFGFYFVARFGEKVMKIYAGTKKDL